MTYRYNTSRIYYLDKQDEIKFERNIIEKITTNERKVVRIIEKLKNCKVTPIGMEDVLSDMLKQKAFQEE